MIENDRHLLESVITGDKFGRLSTKAPEHRMEHFNLSTVQLSNNDQVKDQMPDYLCFRSGNRPQSVCASKPNDQSTLLLRSC